MCDSKADEMITRLTADMSIPVKVDFKVSRRGVGRKELVIESIAFP